MASVQCPDCESGKVSPIASTAVIRDGRVLLLCADCFENRSNDKITGEAAIDDPIDPIVVEPPVSVPVQVARLDETPNERPKFRALSPNLDDITGEIALASSDTPEQLTWHQTLRRNWKQGHSVVVALAFLAIGSTFAFTRPFAGPQLSSPELVSATSTDPGSIRLVNLDFEPSESALIHDLSVSFSESQADLPWVHPLGVVRQMPNKNDRRFGASRPGDRPAECLAGHCGVDLGGIRGASIHAALGGRLVRVKRDPGGRSGKYVAIEHPQGMRSYYMHMDRIHPDLIEGMEVASGEPVGTLGSTGVINSPPHLHFSVQSRRENGGWMYVDPEPMLDQATVLLADGRIPDYAPALATNSPNLADSWLAVGRNSGLSSGSKRARRSGKKGLSDEELGIVIDRGEISFSDDGDGDGDIVVDTGDDSYSNDHEGDGAENSDNANDRAGPVEPETSDTLIDAPRRESKQTSPRANPKHGEVSLRNGTPAGAQATPANSDKNSTD